MKSTLVVGPIKKADKTNPAYEMIRKNMKAMKVGDLFEVSGVDKKASLNVRAAISYYSKQDKCMVTTQLNGDVLTVERVRSAKPSSQSVVKEVKG
jgi:hypothetical protein